jgi:hypothetical protein
MASRTVRRSKRTHRVVSISFDANDAAWVDTLVRSLEERGYPRAARSEVVRTALAELRKALDGLTPFETVKYFAQRDADRLMNGIVDRTLTSGVADPDDASGERS